MDFKSAFRILEKNDVSLIFSSTSEADISLTYRTWAKYVHPDLNQAEGSKAVLAMQMLVALRDKALQPKKVFEPIFVKTKKKNYTLTQKIRFDEISDHYLTDDGFLLKIVRAGGDSDLMENEFKILNSIPKHKHYSKFIPKIVDSFIVSTRNSKRRANVFEYTAGFRTLSEVLSVYKSGIDFRDMTWMNNRILDILGYLHMKNIVHGYPGLNAILIDPVGHGAQIQNWYYSVGTGTKMSAINTSNSTFIPPEVKQLLPVGPKVDIFVLGNVMKSLLNKEAPQKINGFFDACTIQNWTRRPIDAHQLLDDFNELITKLVGPRKYRLLEMPPLVEC